MYPSVYQHHTTRIVNAMFRRSFKIAIDNKILTDKKMYEYDDYDIINIYRNEEGYIKDIINRLDNRNLFKTLSSIRLNQFENPQEIFNNIKKKDLRKAEEEISEKYDLDKNYVFLNIAEYPKFDEMKTQVFDGEEIYHLSEISSIVAALKTARFNYPDISLYIPKEYGDKIERFRFEDYLNLPEIAKGKFDKIHMRQAKLFE
jgi:HD superfamily phosphohydrolase